jgi:4-amino-4-deoxy-L-arabinose transferase-like glycosyltransferase
MRRLLMLLLAVACIGYVINLGAASIWDANEAFYVETPREMIESGDYVSPTFNYEPRVNKPVLSYWVVAGLYQLFGVSVGVQRAAIAAAALVMIVSVFLLTRAVSGDPLAPLVAAAGLSANPRFFMFARRILIDMNVTMLMTVTLTCFALAERDAVHRRRWLVAMYVAVGLGVLTKGPVAAALPALVFLIYLAIHRELHRLRDMMLPAGLAIVLVIVAPWYVAQYRVSGWTNIVSFLVTENLGRYTSVIGPQKRDLWFYLPVVFTDGLPWSLCLPGAIAVWLRDRRSSQDATTRLRTLLLLWIGVIVGVYSGSATKQDLYIFPIVAAVTALGADVVARTLRGAIGSRWLTGALWTAVVGLIAAGAGVLYLFARTHSVYTLDGARAVAMLWMIGGGVLAAFLLRRHLACSVVAALVIPIAFNWLLMWRVLPSFERYKPVVPLSKAFLERAQPDDALVHYDVALPSMVFYTHRPIEMLYGPELGLSKLQETLKSGRQGFVVMDESKYGALKDEIGVPTCVVARQLTSDVKLRELLAGEPPPAVLLVSTRCL